MKSIIILFVAALVILVVSYLGYSAHSERLVYGAVIYEILKEVGPGSVSISEMNVFISRPLTCSIKKPDLPSDDQDIFENYMAANNGAKPIPLTSLEGIVPVISWEDTKKLYATSYTWSPEGKNVVWVSRVGFNAIYSEAMICLGILGQHASGALYYLRRENGEWRVENIYLANLFT